MVTIFIDYGSGSDWYLMFAACSKGLVKTAEGLRENGKKERFGEKDEKKYWKVIIILLLIYFSVGVIQLERI